MKKYVTAGMLTLILTTAGACDLRSPEQVRPTHGGPGGECIEFDDEPCDDDPFDTDDDGVIKVPKRKPTKRR